MPKIQIFLDNATNEKLELMKIHSKNKISKEALIIKILESYFRGNKDEG